MTERLIAVAVIPWSVCSQAGFWLFTFAQLPWWVKL